VIEKKKPGVASTGRKLPFPRSDSTDSSLVPIPAQVAIERLKRVLAQIDQLPLSLGPEGCALLDALELAHKIRERIREKARDLLTKNPRAIPHWYTETINRRQLDKDTAKVFEALALSDIVPGLDAITFLKACTVSLPGINRLINEEFNGVGLSLDELDREISQALADVTSFEPVTRLLRDREAK
jgi:hypothetical protein